MNKTDSNNPLADLEEWEDFLKERYPKRLPKPNPSRRPTPKRKGAVPQLRSRCPPLGAGVLSAEPPGQTYDFRAGQRKEFLRLNRRK